MFMAAIHTSSNIHTSKLIFYIYFFSISLVLTLASLQPPQKKRHKKKKHTWHISHAISSSPVLLKPLCDLRARGCPVARLSQQTQAALASRRAKLCEERPQFRRSHGQPRAGAPWWGRIKVVPKTAMARDGIGSC